MMMPHFVSGSFWDRFGLPVYSRSVVPAQGTGKCRTHRRILQELQWKGPRGRWTLKSPEHLLDLPGLLEAYPDACLVQTHREPGSVLASLASLVYTNRSMFAPDIDPIEVGRSVRELWGTAFERSALDRNEPRIGAASFDVSYRELLANPFEVVRTIYERFDPVFTDDYRVALRSHLERERTSRAAGGEHSYRATDFGLSRAELAEAFPTYRGRFGALLTT